MDAFRTVYFNMSPFFQVITSLILIFVLPVIAYEIFSHGLDFICKFCVEVKEKISPSQARLRDQIESESPRIKQLNELNSSFSFYEILPYYSFYRKCLSKTEFDRTDLDAFFSCVAKENIELFKKYDWELQENKRKFADYQREYAKIEHEIRTSNEKEKYKSTELALAQEKKKSITGKYDIIVYKKYSSPYGRNHLSKKKVYQREDVERFIKIADDANLEKEQKKAEIAYQRSLMTDSLRWDIMKRDNFRCVRCGATADDGVKLHVDHIIPVSKGGKTIPSNLRTLCERCNLGKRDKYDPYGPN